MTRPISISTANSLTDEVLRPILLTELNLGQEPLRLTSGPASITYNGATFIANGWILPVDGVQESTDIGNYGFDLTLSGVSVALLSIILSNQQKNGLGTVWMAILNENQTIIGEPIVLFRGLIDACTIDDKIDNPTVKINMTNDLARLDTSQNFRFTQESQTSLFPGDLGFQYVTKLENWSGFWGKSERPKWLKKPKARKK